MKPYKNDKQHGVAKSYYENGNLRYEVPFKKGNKHGVEKEYDKNGKNRS